MDQNQLLQLLAGLRSADNEMRKAAEAQYDSIIQAQAPWMMSALAEVCATSQDTGVVTIGLILLRKLFGAGVFEGADEASQETVKGRLLEILQSAAFGPQRGSAAACVSALAVRVFGQKKDWTVLWESVFHILGSGDSGNELKTVCCEIISTTASTMTSYFTSHADCLAAGLKNCLVAPGDSMALKAAAFSAAITLATLGMCKQMSPLVPEMIKIIHERLGVQDWENAEKLTSSIIEGITQVSQLFDDHTAALLSGMMQVAATPSVGATARHMAIESLLSYCEEQPKTVRRVADFAIAFFQLLFQYTLNPDFDETWDTTEDGDDDLEEQSDYVIGCAGLDRIASALGGRKLQATAQQLFAENIQSTDWKRRNAAISLILYSAEGMSNVFEKHLTQLLTAILPALHDEVKYVRSVALDCIGQLSQDFAPTIQVNCHALMLPAVIEALRDPVPRVAASAASCLDAFFDNATGDEDDGDDDTAAKFAPYVERCCVDCVALLNSTQLMFVRERALSALSSVTSTCKSQLTPYVANLVPVYQEVLALPDSAEVMESKCKAIECVTLLACGVGKEAFGGYASGICTYLSSLAASGLKNDDPRFRFLLRGWTCMVECLQDDSLPYLQGVMPMLISLMNLECDVVVEEAEVGDAEDEGEQEPGVESIRLVIPGVGERVARFHSALIEDKELASNVVNAMLMELGGSLQPYLHDIATAAIGLLNFSVNSSIRENGALILQEVMEAYVSIQSPESHALARAALPNVMEALATESEEDVMETLMQTVSRCVSSFPDIITPENAKMVGDKLYAALEELVKQRNEVIEKKKSEQDEDELDSLEEKDEMLQANITSASELIGTLLERAGTVFAPIFSERFFPIIAQWLQPKVDDYFVSRAQVILCDFVEHAPSFVSGSLPTILNSALYFTTSRTDEDLLQSNFYLINQLVLYLGQYGTQCGVSGDDFVVSAQTALVSYFNNPTSRKPDYQAATCNAVSAYVSMLQFFGQPLTPVARQMLSTIVAFLPCGDDQVEAIRVHDRILGWVVQRNPILAADTDAAGQLIERIKAAKPDNLSAEAKQQLAAM